MSTGDQAPSQQLQSHAIAPAVVLRGDGAWREAIPRLVALTRRPLLLGRSAATRPLREQLAGDLTRAGLSPVAAELEYDCCEQDLQRLALEARAADCDAVLAAGGGKVMDAGKLLADRLGLPCITVPTSAATCAGWTALANLYSPAGAFEGDVALAHCPDLLVFDHGLVRQAPPRTLASGIADAMAKWYEASVSSGASGDGLVQQAVQQARVLRDQLLLEGAEALADPGGPGAPPAAAVLRAAAAAGQPGGSRPGRRQPAGAGDGVQLRLPPRFRSAPPALRGEYHRSAGGPGEHHSGE